MELTLIRSKFTEKTTISDLWVGNMFECMILEDRVRDPGVKIPKETAIPYGRYRIAITWSQRFGCLMPILLDVPMFTGIRIHAAGTQIATDKNTEGCLVTGLTIGDDGDSLLYSKQAYAHLLRVLKSKIDTEPIWITIKSASGDNYVPHFPLPIGTA